MPAYSFLDTNVAIVGPGGVIQEIVGVGMDVTAHRES